MTVTNISNLRKKLYSYINCVIEYDEPLTVTTKNGNIVVISEVEYKSLLETLYLVSQKDLVEKIKEGEQEDIFEMSSYNPN